MNTWRYPYRYVIRLIKNGKPWKYATCWAPGPNVALTEKDYYHCKAREIGLLPHEYFLEPLYSPPLKNSQE